MWGFIPICQMASTQLLVGQNCPNIPVCTLTKAIVGFLISLSGNCMLERKRRSPLNLCWCSPLCLISLMLFSSLCSSHAGGTD